jgi:hypothetical protein
MFKLHFKRLGFAEFETIEKREEKAELIQPKLFT